MMLLTTFVHTSCSIGPVSSLVTRALTVAPLKMGWGKSVCSLISKEADPRFPDEKYINRVHCISYVLISGVCVRRELIFPYVIFVIFKYIRFCLRRKALHSLGSEG